MADAETQLYARRRGELVAGNYRLERVLGVGGMGVVYTALQHSLDRVVAVKLPRPELAADPDVQERLRIEAIAGSRIEHRSSVRVLDYGMHAGAPYLVMEHVAGPLLGQLLTEHGPLPVAAAIRFVREIAAVLEEAHANGIVHADVKCDNVLVETSRDGTMVPRLIDWGIARIHELQTAQSSQFVTGTPEYVAPEVVLGEPPSCAADVYALGVMLYELITGATPFAGSAQVMRSKLEEVAVPIAARCPELDVHLALDALVLRSLSRDPAKRFAHAGDFARALEHVLASSQEPHRHEPARTPSPMAFAAEATTATMSVVQPGEEPASPKRRTGSVVGALEAGDVHAIVVAYLDLARSLVDEHRLDQAIAELERGVELLSVDGNGAPVWRLLLTLAALYDGTGDRKRARIAARLARERAERDGSAVGSERAERLAARLARSACGRRSRPW
ncbi:MAG TPA: protein kinase [Kofleriaceae bacterium]|nr:protein kinase [Kofleriaceae bacterium]